jgi:hypothetical protein
MAGASHIMTRAAVPGLAAFLLCGRIGGATCARALEITPAAWATGDWIEATITGSPLAAPDSISLLGSAGDSVQASQIESAGDTITFLLDLRHAAPGWYDLRLATLTGDAHTEPQCFEVRPLALPAAWFEPVRLTEDPEPSEHPKIAVDGLGQVHVVWQNARPASDHLDVQYRRWTGSAWTDFEYLVPTGG